MSPEEIGWLRAVAALITGLGGGRVWDYFSKKRDSKVNKQATDQSGFEILQKAWKDEFHRLEDKIDEMHRELGRRQVVIETLENEVVLLKTRMTIMVATTPSLPIPAWKKSPDGVMLGLNEAYERTFLSPRGFKMADYVGAKDEKIWGKDLADHFRKNDDQAIKSKKNKATIFEERGDKTLEDWVFLKYPEFIEDTLVSVSGIAIPKKDYLKIN